MQVFLLKKILETVSNIIQKLCGIILYHAPNLLELAEIKFYKVLNAKQNMTMGYMFILQIKKNPFIWCIIYNLSNLCVLQCEGIPQAQKLICQLLELLPIIRDTICMGIQPDNKEVGKNGRYMQDDKMVQNCLRMYQVLQRYGRSKKFDTKVATCFLQIIQRSWDLNHLSIKDCYLQHFLDTP